MTADRRRSDELELDLERYELRRGECVLRLEKNPMELLILLTQKKDQLVHRQEIIEKLWGKDVFLDTEQGINTAVRKIRLVLHDDPEHPKFVQTVVGKGYRFIGPISILRNEALALAVVKTIRPAADASPPAAASIHKVRPRWKSKNFVASLLVLTCAMVVLWISELRSRPSRPAIHSIAVLPLQNLSGDPGQEYFADGMTEELITTLASKTDLRVTSRTSTMALKGQQKSAREISQALGVDAVVEGSIARSGNKVRVTAQLIDAHADRHLWANEYNSTLTDILRLQEEVAHDVALQVSGKMAARQGQYVSAAKTVNPQAHDLYLRARQYAAEWNEPAMLKAIELYQQAINLQPDYAAAYVGLADAHSLFGTWGTQESEGEWANVREAASKALSLDSSVPHAHAQLAWVKHIYDWDTSGAEEEFQKAFKTDRNTAETHVSYGLFLAQIGRVEEGLAESQLAEELDPLSSRISGTREKMFMIARRYDDVFKQAKRTRELYLNSYVTSLHVAETYQLLGRYAESIDEFEAHPEPGAVTQQEATAFAKKLRIALQSQGPKGYWGILLRDRLDNQADDHCLLGYSYFRTGDNENGYRQLELAIKVRDRNLRQMKTHPMWDFVRDDPRFQDVLHRVGF